MKRKNEITDELVMCAIEKHKQTIVRWVMEEIKSRAKVIVPPVLATEEAKIVLSKLRNAGYLDKNNQPKKLSLAEKGILASEIAQRLGIKNLWVVFSIFWNIDKERLRYGYNLGINQQKTMLFLHKIHTVLG